MPASAVTLQEHTYLGWPAWRLANGLIELELVPQVGGRIMRFALQGEDLVFTHPELRGCVEPVTQVGDIHAKKRDMGFRLWGGEKTWLAPQTRWTDGVPFLDLDSGHYTIDILQHTPHEVRLRMQSPICRETGVVVSRTITMRQQEQQIDLTHTLVNASAQPVTWGLWSVSQLLKPAQVYLPRRIDSPYPGGVKTFDDEGESCSARPRVVHEVGTLARITCQDVVAFKFGVDASEGWLLGVCDRPGYGALGYLTTYPVCPDQPYGHGCKAEVYNSDVLPYFEIEVHGPLVRLAPGASTELRETRRIISLDAMLSTEDDIRRVSSPYDL